MLSYGVYLLAVLVLVASFFAPGGPTGAGWTLYPPQAILSGTPGRDWGIILMLFSLILFIAGFTMGGLNYVVTVLQGRTRGMTLMRLPLTVWGIFTATVMALLAFPALFVGSVMMLLDRLLGLRLCWRLHWRSSPCGYRPRSSSRHRPPCRRRA